MSNEMRAYAEIELDNIEYNYAQIRTHLRRDTRLCCVVKANGYGHGAVRLAALFENIGADFLAVSNLEEALQLRQGGISLPILILGYTPAEHAKTLSLNDISQCVYSLEYGKKLAQNAKKCGVKIKIHVKLDTGMGRIGFLCRDEGENELSDVLTLCKNEAFIPEGLFTHFALADEDSGDEYTRKQFSYFDNARRFLEKNGLKFEICHTSNSAALFKYPEYHLDMVRVGLALYGISPTESQNALDLKPAMKLCSVISHKKTLKTGESVSYGRTFTAPHDMTIATVPIGYADGLFRATGESGYRLMVSGKPAAILGRICMDQLMIDVSDIDCSLGDAVTIFGEEEPFTAASLAFSIGTIPYEVICSVGARVPRVFIQNGKIIATENSLCE